MNKVKRVIIMLVMLLIVTTINFNSYAAMSLNGIENSSQKFLSTGQNGFKDSGVEMTSITDEIVPIVKILTVFGILIIGICMVILGIQWVMAKPSPEAQAKLKVKFVSLTVAAGVLFSSYTIWSMVVSIMDNIDG